jgi:Helix-turn-helix domain
VSVEAISWVLNLAPVPRDRGGKPNPACKAVLIGLASHAGPDGKEAFPAVRTLIRYTCLPERTVRTALDRLETDGIIRPCDPAIVAAKIKRADQRPQGWDLAMHLIRDDLDDEDLAVLERQFPGLTARIDAMRGARKLLADGADSEVQQLHPAPRPVDHAADEVQSLHPAGGRGATTAPTGCNCCRNGVQQLHPNRPWNHPQNRPPPARAHATPIPGLRPVGLRRAAARASSSHGSGRAGR